MATNATNRYTGDTLYVSFAGVNVYVDGRTLTVSESQDQADSSAGANPDNTHILTRRGAEFSLEYLETIGTAGSAVRNAIRLGASGTLIYAPEGTATGRPKYECVASVTSVERDYPFDDVVTVSASLLKNGAWIAHYEQMGSVW